MSAGLAAVVVLAVVVSSPLVIVLQLRGDRRRWSPLGRIGFAALSIAALLGAQSASAEVLGGALFSTAAALGTLPFVLVFTDGASAAVPLVRCASFASLATAWSATFFAVGVAAAFALLPRPTLALRRWLRVLLVATAVLAVAGGGGLVLLDPAAAAPQAEPLATRVAWVPWPLAVLALGLAMRDLFPPAAAETTAALPEPEGWRW